MEDDSKTLDQYAIEDASQLLWRIKEPEQQTSKVVTKQATLPTDSTDLNQTPVSNNDTNILPEVYSIPKEIENAGDNKASCIKSTEENASRTGKEKGNFSKQSKRKRSLPGKPSNSQSNSEMSGINNSTDYEIYFCPILWFIPVMNQINSISMKLIRIFLWYILQM